MIYALSALILINLVLVFLVGFQHKILRDLGAELLDVSSPLDPIDVGWGEE